MEGQAVEPVAALGAAKALGSATDIAELLENTDELTSVELWKRIVAEGRDAEVLAHLKAIADANPNDPEAQLTLGQGYLGRTPRGRRKPPSRASTRRWLTQRFDAALEADPEHWEARFTKATALSFWPPVFGKQASAIKEFETLISQQSGQAPQQEPRVHSLAAREHVSPDGPDRQGR